MRFFVLRLLLTLFFFLHLHPSSSSTSPNNLLSAFSQQQDHVTDEGTLKKLPIKKDGGVKWVDKKGGGGGHASAGHGGGGHASGHGVGSAAEGMRGTDPGRTNGAVIPLYAAGAAGSHHVNNNHHHGKNSGTINCIHLPYLAFVLLGSILLLLHIQHGLW